MSQNFGTWDKFDPGGRIYEGAMNPTSGVEFKGETVIRVGVVGATGYAGEELVDILAKHGDIKISSLSAIIEKPTNISDIFPRLNLSITKSIQQETKQCGEKFS